MNRYNCMTADLLSVCCSSFIIVVIGLPRDDDFDDIMDARYIDIEKTPRDLYCKTYIFYTR